MMRSPSRVPLCLVSALVLSTALASCEIRIGSDGKSGVFFSSFSTEFDGNTSMFLSGKGSISIVNGRVKKLGDSARVYILRDVDKESETEFLIVRQGNAFETAMFRQGTVTAVDEKEREWLEGRFDLGKIEFLAHPGIAQENVRIKATQEALNGNSIDWSVATKTINELLFPRAILKETLALTQREKLSTQDETGLIGLLDTDASLFRHKDRDRIALALASRNDLSSSGIASLISNIEAASYSNRTHLASKLTEQKAFDRSAATAMLNAVDEIPYDGRAQVLASLWKTGEACPQEDWLETVLEEAPYDRRTRLVLDALEKPSQSGGAKLARAALSRLDDFPYDRRSDVFSRCLQDGFTQSDIARLVDHAMEDLPYHARRRALESMIEHPSLGIEAAREGIRRVDDLPYHERDGFLIGIAGREDLPAADQVRLVRQTLEEVTYHARAKVLRALLANPKCSQEAKDAIWNQRKELPKGQREEIEELFRK